MYIPSKNSTQLSKTEDYKIISSTLTTITNCPNTNITVDTNTDLPLWYWLTKDHRELIEDILLNSNHITLNTNTPICLPCNQTKQTTSSDITTA